MKKEKKKRLHRIAERAKVRRERKLETVNGKITITHSGFGFVTLPENEQGEKPEDVFIPPQFVGDAMDGDDVKVALLPPRDDHPGDRDRGPAGKVIEVIGRNREELVGELLAGHRVRPLNKRMPDEIEISGSRNGAKRGDWVKVKLLSHEDGVWRGAVRKVLGRAGVIAADLDAVMAEYDLAPVYSAKDDEEAAKIEPREIAREDHTGALTLTIDPFDAKDFDDALSIAPGEKPSEVVIGVHISDVAAFIAPKSKFDKQAEKRSFSCYLPGRTLPMLPKALTAKISLQAGVNSNAHSVFLTVEKETGRVVSFRRCHTVVKVDHRLNYEEVQEFLDHGKAPADWSDGLKKELRLMLDVTRNMRKYRKAAEGFIELDLPEVRVLCSEADNKILGMVSKMPRESEQLVEECMLAANSAVGTELGEKGIAGIYRVHPQPDPEKIAEFTGIMEDSFGLTPGDLTERKACNAFLAGLPNDPRRPVILSLMLRSMPRAYYLEKPALHFGLGKTRYAHFTSPIRRYPDLIVHQQLWNYDTKTRTRTAATMTRVAADCSMKEENNDAAYFAANDRLKLRYLEERLDAGLDNFYEGVIVKVVANGIQVEIRALGMYGFVERERLPGEFRRSEFGFRQERGHKNYKPGDFIYLQLSHIDFARGTALFVPAGHAR